MFENEWNNSRRNQNPTKIIGSSDIGPVTKNNPGAIYKSRLLSGIIRSAMSTRSLRSQSITSEVSKYHLMVIIYLVHSINYFITLKQLFIFLKIKESLKITKLKTVLIMVW